MQVECGHGLGAAFLAGGWPLALFALAVGTVALLAGILVGITHEARRHRDEWWP